MDRDFTITKVLKAHFRNFKTNKPCSDSVRHLWEILSDQLNIYHTTISSKLNDNYEIFDVFSVIFISVDLIAGIYGQL